MTEEDEEALALLQHELSLSLLDDELLHASEMLGALEVLFELDEAELEQVRSIPCDWNIPEDYGDDTAEDKGGVCVCVCVCVCFGGSENNYCYLLSRLWRQWVVVALVLLHGYLHCRLNALR